MKKSMKFIASAVAVVALLVNFSASAQTSEPVGDSKATRLGIGLNVGVPTTDGFDFAIGGDVRLQKDFSGNVSGMISAGYTSFSAEDDAIDNVGFIPVKAGLKVFPLPKFYISGELGAGFATEEGGKTAFVWAPGIGYGFNNGIDLGVRYEDFSREGTSLGQVALRVAYGFRLR